MPQFLESSELLVLAGALLEVLFFAGQTYLCRKGGAAKMLPLFVLILWGLLLYRFWTGAGAENPALCLLLAVGLVLGALGVGMAWLVHKIQKHFYKS